MSWVWIVGCTSEGLPPRVEANGGGAGYWPADSRTAVEGAAAAGFEGIELDVVLTKDRVPVLSPDLWIRSDRCTGVSGEPIARDVLIWRLTLDALQTWYRCGGVPDPEFPNALVASEPVMTFDAALNALHDAPSETLIHLDIAIGDQLSAKPEMIARQVLSRWWDEDLPQALYVTSTAPEVLTAFDAEARTLGFDVPTDLVIPEADALAFEVDRWSNQLDYVTIAAEAGADGLSLPSALADRSLIAAARDEGLTIEVWNVDDPRALAQWTVPGRVDAVITNYPGDVP